MTRRTPKHRAAIATGTGRRDGERSGHLWKSNPVNLELARARLSRGTSKGERVPEPLPPSAPVFSGSKPEVVPSWVANCGMIA